MSKPIWVDVIFEDGRKGMIDFSKIVKFKRRRIPYSNEAKGTDIYYDIEGKISELISSPTFEELQELLHACSAPIKVTQYDWHAISGVRFMAPSNRKPETE